MAAECRIFTRSVADGSWLEDKTAKVRYYVDGD